MFTREDYDRLVDALAETEGGKKITSGILHLSNVEQLLREIPEIAQKLGLKATAAETMQRYSEQALSEIDRGVKQNIDRILRNHALAQMRELAMHM